MDCDLTTSLLNATASSRDGNYSSTETVKVNVNGMNRKVVIHLQSFDAMERSLSNALGLPVGSFSISYIDSDGDVIALPHARVTIDEMEEFKKVKLPRLIIRSNGESVKSSFSCASVKNKIKECAFGASSSASYCLKTKKDEDEEIAMMYEPLDSVKLKQQQMVDEDGEEETDVETEDATDSDDNKNDNKNDNNDNESNLHDNIPNWARVFSDRTTVRSIQDAMASHIITDFVNAIGVSLVAGEKSATFQVMFSYGPKIYALFNDVFIKHPELKDVIGEIISFLALGPRNKKSCLFHKHRKQRQRNASGEVHHHRHHHGRRHRRNHMDEFRDSWTQHFFNGNANTEPVSRQPIHAGVVCDGCSTNCELRAKSIQQGCSSMEKCGSRYIAGVRYKSYSVENFDLCESCEASQVFQKSHGPFLKLVTLCQPQTTATTTVLPPTPMPTTTTSNPYGNASAQASSTCHRRRGFKHGFGFMGGNESHGMKRHHEQSSCQQPSPFASLFSGACSSSSSSSSIPAPLVSSSPSQLSLLLDGSQEKRKEDKCAITSLFAAASSFCSTIKSSDLKLSDESKGKSMEKKKSSDMGLPNDEIDKKLIKQGKDIMDTFMKAAVVAPSSSIVEGSNNNIESGIDEVPEKWKSAIETLQSLGFVEWKRYLSILEEENGNIDRAIAKIVALPEHS